MRISDWSSDVCSSDLIGKRDHERDGAAVQLGDADQIVEHDRLQFLADVVDLGLGQRHESPIVRPGIVEDRENDRGLAPELRFVDLADEYAIVALARLEGSLEYRRKFVGDVESEGQQVLAGTETRP